MGNSLAGFNVAVVQAQSEQFLETGIHLLMHGDILRGDITQFLKQTRTTLVVVVLCILKTLPKGSGSLGSLDRTSLGVNGAGTLHSRGRSGTGDSPLATGGFLLLDLASTGRGLRGAVALGSGVVVDTTHVVVEVPSPWESISWYCALTAFPQAEVGVISVAM